MDIMNNMTVSTSKLTFSLIAVATLLIAGSAFTDQEAFGAITFHAIHNSTTQTEIIFSEVVNGTLNNQNWYVNGIMATAASNGTAPAHANNNYAAATDGFLNNTLRITLTHAAITDSAATHIVLYAKDGAPGVDGVNSDIPAANAGNLRTEDGRAQPVYIANATSAIAQDGISPQVTSAIVLGPKTIEITFDEPVGNQNATASNFSLVGTDALITTMTRDHNGTDTMLLGLQNPIDWRDTFTLSYSSQSSTEFLTDATNSPFHGDSTVAGSGMKDFSITMLGSGQHYGCGTTTACNVNSGGDGKIGLGNQLANFTGFAINSNSLTSISNDNCFDCKAPTITNIQLSVPSANPMDISADDAVHVTTEIGDTVTIAVTYSDNKGAASIPFAGIYTNFVDTPEISNLYYKNNFDGLLQMSTSYYEWNVRGDDVAYDNDGAVTWDVASAEVINDTQRMTIAYTLTINDDFESSQVWIDVADANGNYLKTSLPITIEVAGDPSLTFASNGNQKVTSFFNESILFAIVSQWSTLSDNTVNASELSSVLGIEDSVLPEWTTSLATWAADDKIDIADMVIAVEYVINQ
jgi:hypothetical protein